MDPENQVSPIPSTADTPTLTLPDTNSGGAKGGGKGAPPPLDPQALQQTNQNIEVQRPLIRQQNEEQANLLAQQGQTLQESANRAQDESDAALVGIERAGQTAVDHSNEIWNKVMSMKPLMTTEDYWNSKSTGDKVGAAIGLFLGGANGPASNAMQQAINHDFEIDKAQHEEDFKKYAM